jgi:hypothetical protein
VQLHLFDQVLDQAMPGDVGASSDGGVTVYSLSGTRLIGDVPTAQPAGAGRWETVMRGVLAGDPCAAAALVRVEDMAGSSDNRDLRGDVRGQIREFLSSRRARISPEQAGLPVYRGAHRRVSARRTIAVAENNSVVAVFTWPSPAESALSRRTSKRR